MPSQVGQQIITKHMRSNILRGKGNQTIKIEIFFLKNHTQNVMERLVSEPFKKLKTDHIFGSTI